MQATARLPSRAGFSAAASWRCGLLRHRGHLLHYTAVAPLAASLRHASHVGDGTVNDDMVVVGVESAAQLFDDVSDFPRESTYTSTTTPQREPTSEAAQAALQARRLLHARSTELHEVTAAELREEVARDMKDGVAAVPPLAPAGWRVLHPSGSSFFTMSRVCKGGYRNASETNAAAALRTGTAAPRYRSVHDVMSGRSPPRQPAPSPTRGGDGGGHHYHGIKRGRPLQYARSDLHVTLFAPFRSLDLTLHDPTVDICEWNRFDVLVRKTPPSSSSFTGALGPHVTPLEGQQEVWDEQRCLFLRLACVNGELRIRALQNLSHKLARALEEHAVFGKGEPLYLELLRRQRHGRTLRRAGGRDRWHTAVSPVRVMDTPGTASTTPSLQRPLDPPVGAAAAAAGLLTSQFDRGGEYARTFAYGGPYLTELSKELREALQDYVMVDLGISSEVAEYVCQMQFFLEQEEYVGWLAQWGQLATTLQQTL